MLLIFKNDTKNVNRIIYTELCINYIYYIVIIKNFCFFKKIRSHLTVFLFHCLLQLV